VGKEKALLGEQKKVLKPFSVGREAKDVLR
jgi:hypothetical protein